MDTPAASAALWQRFTHQLAMSLSKTDLTSDEIGHFLNNAPILESATGEIQKFLVRQARPVAYDNPFSHEVAEHRDRYRPGWRMANLETQARNLKVAIPKLQIPELPTYSIAPVGYDGYAILPKIAVLGRIWNIADPYGKNYGRIVSRVLSTLYQTDRRQRWWVEGSIKMDSDILQKLSALEARDDSEVLIVPANLGEMYAGHSVRCVRYDSKGRNQLALGVAHTGLLLITIPDRLVTHTTDLWLACAGDDRLFKSNSDDQHFSKGYFYFNIHPSDPNHLRLDPSSLQETCYPHIGAPIIDLSPR